MKDWLIVIGGYFGCLVAVIFGIPLCLKLLEMWYVYLGL